jgi:hypothetical protein
VTRSSSPLLGLAASLAAMGVLAATLPGVGVASVARQVDEYLTELLARSQLSGCDELPHVQPPRGRPASSAREGTSTEGCRPYMLEICWGSVDGDGSFLATGTGNQRRDLPSPNLLPPIHSKGNS